MTKESDLIEENQLLKRKINELEKQLEIKKQKTNTDKYIITDPNVEIPPLEKKNELTKKELSRYSRQILMKNFNKDCNEFLYK